MDICSDFLFAMKRIKWLFFDLGHTLVNEDMSQRKRIENAVSYLNSVNVDVTYKEFYHEVQNASRNFKSPFVTAFSKFCDDKSVFIPYPAEYEALYDDTVSVLSALKNKYDLAIIANQFSGTEQRLKSFGIYDDFKFILASSDVGVSKPNPIIFETALEKAGCSAAEAVMIGDRIDNDIAPAKSLGINTVWIRQGYGGLQSPEKFGCAPDFTVNSLKEILDIL